MEEQKTSRLENSNINIYSLITDILHNWLAILLIVVSAGLLMNVYQISKYQPQYTTKTTMVITNYGVDNNVYKNLQNASKTASRFSQMLKNSALQRIVVQEIGLDSFQGTVSAYNPDNTNLLEFKVTSSTPELAFLETKAILDNYGNFSKELLGNINLTILEAPTAPTAPSNPLNTTRRNMQAMMITGFALLFILGVLSATKDTIRSPKDVELKLDTILLSSIHHEEKYHSLLSKIKNINKKTSILITDPVTSFRYVETIKKLSSRILNKMHEKNAHTVLVTSVLENEGKSTVATNIALAMAQEGRKVLLIDADFRKPSQFKILNLKDENFTSLISILKSSNSIESYGDISVPVPGTHLRCILNKTAAPQSMEMFSTGQIKKILEYYKEKMDYIVVDSSPMQLVADAEELASMVDCNVLVVRQHMVEARDINDAIDALNGGHGRMIGCVFNNVHSGSIGLDTSSYGYGYGYGYGHNYNYHYGGNNEQ